ncbi:SMP-30/gluconolactonase/LRE family protein [Thermodesulfitimonas sp.]
MDLSGKEVGAIGRFGRSGGGEFYYPNGIAVSPDGRIFVADTNNCRVQIFDTQGKFLAMWTGDLAKHEGYFATPTGIAFDKKGNVYVADALSQRVTIFSKEGKMLPAVAKQVGAPEEKDSLCCPTGVWIDSRQRLYVADYGNLRVVVYDLK